MPELADVVVVGGGIVGAALTAELARRAMRVVLVEAGELAREATGRGFAWINASSKDDDEAYHRLNARGVAAWRDLGREVGAETLGLRMGGSLFWARSNDTIGQAYLREKAALLQTWETPVVLLSAEEIGVLEPRLDRRHLEGAVGLYAPSEGWANTQKTVAFLTQRAVERGALIRTNSPAISFTRDIGGAIATVRMPQTVYSTRHVVLTAGRAIPDLLPLLTGSETAPDFPLRRVPGVLVETRPDSASETVGRVCYPPDAGSLHLRPTPNGGLLLGANDVDDALNLDAPRIPDEVSRQLLQRAAAHWPELASLAERADDRFARLCIRPVPADDRPIVGPLPTVSGVSVLVTHSGVTLGLLLARLHADEIVTGRPSPALAPYRLDRFNFL